MLLLTSTSDAVQVVTSASGNVKVHASFMDVLNNVVTPGRTNTATITGATTTTVVANAPASTARNVKMLTVRNTDASVAQNITVQHTDGSISEPLWIGTLAAGEALVYDQDGDFTVFSASGLPKAVNTQQQFSRANTSASTVSASFATDTYLAGSAIAMPSGGPIAGTVYECEFDMVKTAAGTGAVVINVRYGTAGAVADTSRATLTFAAGTAAADTARFNVKVVFRTVGTGTSAVLVASASCQHSLAATGMVATGASGFGQITAVSGGFDSTPVGSILGISFNGAASFSGTCTWVATRALNLTN